MQAEQIAQRMASGATSPEVQIRQTRLRMELAQAWDIAPGERILEIGCGQGDTTAVLAACGAEVLAVDPAEPSYGAPVNLGEATRRLAATDLGSRIEFRLGFDPLAASFPDGAFDAVVMAHCSWYFSSIGSLVTTLRAVRPWARRLCFSEWDLRPADAWGHLLAVLIQAQVETAKPVSEANVRTPLPRSRLKGLLAEAGWSVVREAEVDSSMLDDGRWEIEACLSSSVREAAALPPRLRDLVETQVSLLRELRGETRSLPSYALVAE